MRRLARGRRGHRRRGARERERQLRAFNAGAKTLAITASAHHDSVGLTHEASPGNHIQVQMQGGTPINCTGGTPTDTKINSISFADTSVGGTTILVVSIGPGAPSEGQFNSSEIEITAAMGDGLNDQIWVGGSGLADRVRVGENGSQAAAINLNTVELSQDADISATGVEAVYVNGLGGNDVLGDDGDAGACNDAVSFFTILYGRSCWAMRSGEVARPMW